MKSIKNISNISESDENSEGLLLALKSALNLEELVSDDLWFNWSKRLAEYPFSSDLVCKVAGKNRLPWPAAKKFATFDDYLGMPLKKISKILGRTSLRTLILCVANASLDILPEKESTTPAISAITREVTFDEFYKAENMLDLISSETWDEWKELLLGTADSKRFISDIVDELGGLYWQARWKKEKVSDYCRFSLDKILNTPGKSRTIVICVAKAATDAIAKLNSGDRKNLIPIISNINPCVLPETPVSGRAIINNPDPLATIINYRYPKQLLLSPDSTDFHSNFDRIIIEKLSTQPRRSDPDFFWIPQGQTTTIGCYSHYLISEGFVYVGSNLKSVHGKSKEPSLSRAAYQKWLSTGRKDPNEYIGYVLLYFYGLERRVLADTKDSASARSEVPAIFSEVKRLLSIYGEDVSFHKYAVQFLDFIFKIALSPNSDGSFTLSAEWALACAENDLSMPRRMSVQRCPDEFRELCKIRYNEKYGEGITLLPNKKCFRAAYVPASPSFRGLVELPDQHWPYMEEFSELASQLLILVTNCADELEAYSSYLAKNTHGKNSIVAISFLPVTLLKKQFGEEFQLLIKKLEEHISPVDVVSLPFSSLLPKNNQDGLGEEDVADFASLFSLFNVGIEPDGSFTLSAEWALAYVENDLSMQRRMSVQRCPDELRELYKIRYNEIFRDGVTLLPNKKCIRATYAPASLSFRGLVELPDQHLPDIVEFSEMSTQLLKMVTDCADELEAYCNYLAENPHGRYSIVAISLLPVPLLKKQFGEKLQLLIQRSEEHICSVESVSLPFSSLHPKTSLINMDGLGEEEVADFARLLGKFNIGIEPDPRFVNFTPKAEQDVVLFKIAENAPSSASTEYFTATTILHLAFAVAGGAFNANEERHVEKYLEAWIQHLSANEKTRLRAHYQWLQSSLPDLDCLINKRIKLLIHPGKKEALGRFLVGLAKVNGHIDSDKLKTLKQIHEIFSLNTRSLSRQAAIQPVTIQTADAGTQRGFAIPAPPRPVENFTLDMDSIEEKIAETKVVSAILNNIFSEAEQSSAIKHLKELPTPPASFIGLDAEAFTFMHVLASKLVWEREELEILAAEHNLMLDGTLDSINDASYGHFGIPFFEGDDRIEIDQGIMNKMLSV